MNSDRLGGGSGGESSDWRTGLAQLNPVMARLPASQSAAALLATHGKPDEALAVYLELLATSPESLTLLGSIVQLLFKLNRPDEAIRYRRRACEIDVVERGVPMESRDEVVEYLLAKEGLVEEPAQAPKGYVSSLFDDYADSFDNDLVQTLRYRGPEETYDAIANLSGFQFKDVDILDLGCGTGLVGELLRQHAKRLVGIDISAKMIQQAEAKQIYDELVVGDIVETLHSLPAKYDLIVATDVFVYLGDLCQALISCFHSLVPSGRLVFSVEEAINAGDRGFMLCGSGRFKHSQDYLWQQLCEAGFEAIEFHKVVLRYENDKPVHSLMCSARR